MTATTAPAGPAFDLPLDLTAFKMQMRQFVDDELIPIEGKSMDGHQISAAVRAHLEAEARRRGLWMLHVPEREGGRERGLLSRVVMWEQLGRTSALVARGRAVFGPEPGAMLGEQLNADQRERFLLPLIRGEKLTAFGQTEPEAGSDPARIATTAVRDGDEYVVNGGKRFIGAGDEADFIQLIVATDPEKGARGGISALLVDMHSPGVRIVRLIETVMRDRPAEIVFENVRVPVANRIGGEGDGFKLGQRWLTEGRIKHAARAIGVIERCLELASGSNTGPNSVPTTTQRSYTYDANNQLGFLTSVQTEVNDTDTISHDARGMISSEVFSGTATPNRTYTYDPDGRISDIHSSAFGDDTRTYDADGNVATRTEPGGGGVSDAAFYRYSYYADDKESALYVTTPIGGNIPYFNGNGLAKAFTYQNDGLVSTASYLGYYNFQ